MPYRFITIGDQTVRIPDFKRMLPGGSTAILIVLLVIYLATGIYVVGPDQAGVIRTFGEYTRTATSGLNYHLPWPIESVDKPKITEVKRLEIGYRSVSRGNQSRVIDIPEESLMLTGSLNIVDIDLIVQYKIKDPVRYLFVVRDVPNTIRMATEAVIRQVVGQHTIDEALTTGKGMIQVETLEMLQKILDNYECGVTVIQVQLKDVYPPEAVEDAFREVASAKEDKARLINEAQGYENNIVPKARGEAEEMVLKAEAFKAERVTRAEGDASKFLSVLESYRRSPRVTRQRMLIETMEEVLPGMRKYILETDGGDILNVIGAQLPVKELSKGGN
ncbi:FtsH protease activity modulator HflK [bacterium]|nr:FtsH protease activity modulator HflK [bacterium]